MATERILDSIKRFFDSEAFIFWSYCIGFLVPAYFLARHAFLRSYLEYLISMVIACPVSYWIWRLFKK